MKVTFGLKHPTQLDQTLVRSYVDAVFLSLYTYKSVDLDKNSFLCFSRNFLLICQFRFQVESQLFLRLVIQTDDTYQEFFFPFNQLDANPDIFTRMNKVLKPQTSLNTFKSTRDKKYLNLQTAYILMGCLIMSHLI